MNTTRTLYLHTLDGKPARVIRFTRGREVMVPVSRGVRVQLLPSLAAVRTEQNEVLDDAFRQSKRGYPQSPREVHGRAASDLMARLGYVLVEVPS